MAAKECARANMCSCLLVGFRVDPALPTTGNSFQGKKKNAEVYQTDKVLSSSAI